MKKYLAIISLMLGFSANGFAGFQYCDCTDDDVCWCCDDINREDLSCADEKGWYCVAKDGSQCVGVLGE